MNLNDFLMGRAKICHLIGLGFSLFLMPLTASAQLGVEKAFEVKAIEELKLLIDSSVKYGPGESSASRFLCIRGGGDAKIFDVMLTSEKNLRVSLRVAFMNRPGSEAANVIELKDQWVDIPNVAPESGLTIGKLDKILAILSSEKVQSSKEMYIRRDEKGSVMLLAKELNFTVKYSQMKILSQVIALYFSEVLPDKVVFDRRSGAAP